MSHLKNRAFSLIELSIVILIIGILIAGVTQSSSLLSKAKLMSAQTLTKSSPVAGIENLTSWHEASLMANDMQDGEEVVVWKDLSLQSLPKNDIVCANSCSNALFKANAINNLPAIEVGSGGGIGFPTIYGADSTVFIVARALEDFALQDPSGYGVNLWSTMGMILSHLFDPGTEMVTYSYMFAGDGVSNTITYESSIGADIASIHTIRAKDGEGASLRYWLNGGLNPDAEQNFTNPNFQRDISMAINEGHVIAEVIIFERALKNEERQAIEKYLGKKYAIKIDE
jgi:prepilin-type N-terminal cleavage/methylation domain-containing protein